MIKKILFIEDEKEFAGMVTAYLKKEGFEVVWVHSGQKGLRKLKKKSFDLVILDLGLPDEDGLKLCQKIRKMVAAPIFILTARDGVESKIEGFNTGADDYLVKPASLKELVVRINRLFDRSQRDKFRSSVFKFDGIKFDTISGTLASNNKFLMLTKKEKAVLEYLMLRQGQVLTRMEIMDHVWGDEINLFSNTVNMVISSLRKKLNQLSSEKFIRSVHGLGYEFEANGGNGSAKNE